MKPRRPAWNTRSVGPSESFNGAVAIKPRRLERQDNTLSAENLQWSRGDEATETKAKPNPRPSSTAFNEAVAMKPRRLDHLANEVWDGIPSMEPWR